MTSPSRNALGQVRYTLKTSYRDGTTHIVLEPLDFMARLAARAPPWQPGLWWARAARDLQSDVLQALPINDEMGGVGRVAAADSSRLSSTGLIESTIRSPALARVAEEVEEAIIKMMDEAK